MSTRAPRKARGMRRFERWLVGAAFAIMAFVLEKVVVRSIRAGGGTDEEAEEVTTTLSKGGEFDVDL